MSATGILHALTARGIRLIAEGDKLVVETRPGVLTDADRQTIRRHKPELLRELKAANDRVDVEGAIALACAGLPISAAQFSQLLTSYDFEAIQRGEIPVQTLKAYAASMAEGLRAGRVAVSNQEGP